MNHVKDESGRSGFCGKKDILTDVLSDCMAGFFSLYGIPVMVQMPLAW